MLIGFISNTKIIFSIIKVSNYYASFYITNIINAFIYSKLLQEKTNKKE